MLDNMNQDQMFPLLISIMATAGLLYYAFRVLVQKDMKALYGKTKRKYKDEEKYRVGAGRLFILLAGFSAAMGVVGLFSRTASLLVILTGVVIFMILWKRMDDRYGE